MFFAYGEGVFRCNVELPEEQRPAFQELVRELVEWRLAAYLDRNPNSTPDRIVCKVSHAGGRPILFLPDREKHPGIPHGTVPVLIDGEEYQADFVKIAVNVMRRVGETENVLPEVLRGWFGEGAGRSGTTHRVVYTKEARVYRLAPQTTVGDDPV